MKRFVLLPCVVLFGVLWVVAYSIVSLRSAQPASAFPKIDERFMPGGNVPSNAACVIFVPDFKHRYCEFKDAPINLVIQDQQIIRTSIYTYDSGLTIGDVLTEWGRPMRAAYDEIGTAVLYWSDHSTYVLTGQGFSPFARVSLISYGRPSNGQSEMWRGFTATKR